MALIRMVFVGGLLCRIMFEHFTNLDDDGSQSLDWYRTLTQSWWLVESTQIQGQRMSPLLKQALIHDMISRHRCEDRTRQVCRLE